MRVGNVSFVSSPLDLGQLRGNQFEIILRDVSAEGPKTKDNDASTASPAITKADLDSVRLSCDRG